jgi:hypothetical protein
VKFLLEAIPFEAGPAFFEVALDLVPFRDREQFAVQKEVGAV